MRTGSAKMALMLALAPMSLLTGCVGRTGSSATELALCDQFKPVLWSDADTDDTIAQTKGNNAVGRKVCGWKP